MKKYVRWISLGISVADRSFWKTYILPILGLCAGLALVKYVEANIENFIGGWMIPLIGFLILLAVITLLWLLAHLGYKHEQPSS